MPVSGLMAPGTAFFMIETCTRGSNGAMMWAKIAVNSQKQQIKTPAAPTRLSKRWPNRPSLRLNRQTPKSTKANAIQTGQKRETNPMTMPRNPTDSMPRPYATRMRGLRKA